MKKTFYLIIIFGLSLVLFGCNRQLKFSDKVTFVYTGYFSDGSLFETGEKTIVLGSGEIPHFLEEAIMNKDGRKTLDLSVNPEDAYGPLYESGKLQKIAKFIFDRMFPGFKVGEKRKMADIEGIIKGIETMDGMDYVVFEMNPKQTWDNLRYQIHIIK